MAKKRLIEAGQTVEAKSFMTPKEKALRKNLVLLLIKHHHQRYAKRLSVFAVHIVPLKVAPNFTAAISFEDVVIYISEGFLQDPTTFNQLDVLMRHELSHNLLMHQIRMANKIGKDIYPELGASTSIHELLNTIEDFDISNTRYTDEDKKLVRHMWLNGKEISGLITEDMRASWQNLSLEEMYDKLTEELDQIKNAIIYDYNIAPDNITIAAKQAYQYADDWAQPSRLMTSAEDFIKGNGKIYFGPQTQVKLTDLPTAFQDLLYKIYKYCTDPMSICYHNVHEIELIIKGIRDTSALSPYKLEQISKDGNKKLGKDILIISPEAKWLALELLKSLAGHTAISRKDGKSTVVHIVKQTHSDEYTETYNKIIDACGDPANCSDTELTDIIAGLAF